MYRVAIWNTTVAKPDDAW